MYLLRDYQDAALSAAVNFAKYRDGHGYVTSPGGSGKSVMIAKLAEALFNLGFRVLILARSERLLRQNKEKMSDEHLKHCGIYCAGIGERDLGKPITVASAQSLCGVPNMPNFDFALVDECDEIPENQDGDSQYWQIFKAANNPRIIGFTATNYRLATGLIRWGVEIVRIEVAPLISAGYLCPPVNKIGASPNLSHVKVARTGEYDQNELESIYLEPKLLEISIKKILQYGAQRNRGLIFTQSLKHSDILAYQLEANGQRCLSVSGDTDKDELNDYVLSAHEAGEFKYLLNCQLMQVGYDLPWVDMVAVILSTQSKRRWEQMLYRGTRLYDGKKDFFALDLGGNFIRHGALGSPYKGKHGKQDQATPKGKACPECEEYIEPINAKECSECGFIFPEQENRKIDHNAVPDTSSRPVYTGAIETLDVDDVAYYRHVSRASGKTSLRVDYYCATANYGKISEWLSPHNESDWARGKAQQFFEQRGCPLPRPIGDIPLDELLIAAEHLTKPAQIVVDYGEKFPRIKNYIWKKPEPIEDEIIW